MRHNLLVANDDAGELWAKGLVRRVGRAIKDARGGRSAAWLSDRTAELGFRISPTVIAKLDSGHRGSVLSVAELIVLAYALDIPPGALLYPDLPDGSVEVLPNWCLPSWVALLSLDGEAKGVRSIGGVPDLTPLADMVRRRYELAQERKAMWNLHARELAAAKAEGREPVPGVLESALQQVTRIDRDIAELNHRMAAIGGVVSDGGGGA